MIDEITAEKALSPDDIVYYKTLINGEWIGYGLTEEEAIAFGERWLRQDFMPLPPVL